MAVDLYRSVPQAESLISRGWTCSHGFEGEKQHLSLNSWNKTGAVRTRKKVEAPGFARILAASELFVFMNSKLASC